MPLPPGHLETIGPAGYSEAPVGTGPYKFVEWERDNFIQLTRWEDYPGPKPVIKNIRIVHRPEAAVRVSGLKASEFDLITAAPPENVPSLISDGFQIVVGDSTQSMYIGLNIYGRSEPLADKRVRQALLYAVDMDAIWETVAGGYGTRLQCQIVAPGGFGYNADLVGRYDYDPDKAKELLAEAGFADGLTLPGSVTNARYFRDRPLMDAVVAQWAAVGVNVDLAYLESSEWLQQLINQTLPDAFMNIGLNWYLADNTTSMWGNGLADPAFQGDGASQEPNRRHRDARGRGQANRRKYLQRSTGTPCLHDPVGACVRSEPTCHHRQQLLRTSDPHSVEHY